MTVGKNSKAQSPSKMMNKKTLLDKIVPCLTNNPRHEVSEQCIGATDWETSFDKLLGGLIVKYEHQPDALIKIKSDLTSLVFQVNSVITNAR